MVILKKKQRNTLLAIIFIILVISVVGILFPQAIVDPNGDNGDPEYTPSTELDDIGTPVLEEIDKVLLRYTLEWEFITRSEYTLDKYIILERINSSSWVCIATTTVKHYQTLHIFEAGLYEFKIVARIIYENTYHYSQHSDIKSFEILPEYITPVLEPIVPNPNIDGKIVLKWCEVALASGYKIYRLTDGIWSEIVDLSEGTIEYTDTVDESGEYSYYVASYTFAYEHPSNTESVTVDIYIPDPPPDPDILPQNPSIVIDNGAETTDSFTITLTLSCDNAEEMHFRLYGDYWTNWTSYETTYTLILCEEYLQSDNIFRVGVVFWNENGTTEDAGYGDIYDDITYEEPPEEPPEELDTDKETDYTSIYILIGVLFGLAGIGVFLRYRYKKRKQVITSN